MINITIKDHGVQRLFRLAPKVARRAAEYALDQTAYHIWSGISDELPKVFDNPTPFTKRSLKYTKTKNHNMVASVQFREPPRMEEHYLVPEVEGTVRKHKGFELALGGVKFIPSDSLNLNKYGNVNIRLIRRLMRVLNRAGSTGRGAIDGDFVYLPQGSKRGKLPPGVYQRKAERGRGLNAKTKRTLARPGTYQRGKTKRRISQVVQAKLLKPVLIVGRQQAPTKKRLKFFEIAHQIYNQKFETIFYERFNYLVRRQ